MSPIAAHIGPYRVERELGRGGMGVVYLAQDTRLDRWVAVKALPEAFTADPGRLSRFVREAKILASLNHPGIGAIYGLEEAPSGERFLILELVDGEPLATLLLGGPLAPPDALRLLEEIAGAVGAAHERGVVHRDLKPGNIMLTREGRAKVLDFGLAKVLSARERADGPGTIVPADEPVTTEGIVVGTVPYMSPEQLRGEAVDARSDVFSLGCVLFECLTARRAFQEESLGAVVAAILEGEPDWASLPEATPEGARSLLERCLAKTPERRPADGRAVEAAILSLLDTTQTRVAKAAPPGHNLPAELTSFVGREGEIAACAALLASARLVTLTGIGGGGKTRLALQVARRTLGDYPDGTWLVDLASISDASRVALTVATTLGIAESATLPVEDVLASHLGPKRALVILDNCEPLLEACAGLVRRLLESCASLRILATSREPLGIEGEQVRPVPPLSLASPAKEAGGGVPEAVRLFFERADLVAPGFSDAPKHADDVHEICRRLDGIPLAIELAAARVRVLAIPELRARLDDRFRLLTRHSSLPARHQTLRATIQWSIDHLTDDEGRLLLRLSVFAGGWTLRGAAAVAGEGVDEFAALDLLSHLHDKSLVVVEHHDRAESRYRMLETVRQFARERLAESGEEAAALERHLDFYLVVAEEARPHLAGTGGEPWLARIDLERENLLAAHASCDRIPDGGEKGLRLLWAVRLYWGKRGLVDLGIRECLLALSRPGAQTATAWRSELLFTTSWLAYFDGRYDEAATLAEESLLLCRLLEDRFGAANALAWLGGVEVARGDLDHARERLEEAVSLAREPANRPILPPALTNWGGLKLLEDDLEGAGALFEEALALSREDGRIEGVEVNLRALARVEIRRGRYPDARRRLAEGARIAEERWLRVRGQALLDEAAALATALEQHAIAARLWGASEAARRDMNLSREPSDEAFLKPWTERARAALGDEAFEALDAAGRALSYEEAMAEARAWLEESPPVAGIDGTSGSG